MPVPLSVFDLSPVPDGGTVADALRHSIDLARRAEELGYLRYWVAEHHLVPGVASSQPGVLVGQIAAATRRIRVGSGAYQLGQHTALSIVEQAGMVDALHPGRVDVGLGRSSQGGDRKPPPWLRLAADMLQHPAARVPGFAAQVGDILALFAGAYHHPIEGVAAQANPGTGADVQVWVFGSSAGESARVAGQLGLPFAAGYHIAPATALDAVDAYRAAFRPSTGLTAPKVVVAVDVVVAEDDATAQRLASPYGLWVLHIRRGGGAIPYPTPAQAAAHEWTDGERALVADRVDTQIVGSPETVAAGLRALRHRTGADELLITTITHEHADRVHSYELLAKEWETTHAMAEVSTRADVLVRHTVISDPLAEPMLRELQAEYLARYGPNGEMTRHRAHEFAPPGGAFLLLLSGDRAVAGGAFRRYDERTAELKRVWTHSRFRRRGLGRRVVAELEAEAVRRGYRRIVLSTGPKQPEARGLYLSTGYLLDIEAPGPDLTFRKELA